MKTLKEQKAYFGIQVEWDINKAIYIAIGNYCSNIESDVIQFEKDCKEFLAIHVIDENFKKEVKKLFPDAEIILKANKAGIIYFVKYNDTRENVMNTLSEHNLLKVYNSDGKWNPILELDAII